MSKKFKLPIFLRILAALFLLFILTLSYTAFFILQNATFDNKYHSDAIIILGSRTRANDSYNPCLYERVNHGVNLYKAGLAKKIIVSGGYNPDDRYFEAEDMRKIALSLGAKDQDILLEKKSTSTFENLSFSKSLMTSQGLKSSIIVTEAYHSPRANLIAQKLEMIHSVSPTTNTPCWNSGVFHINYFLIRDAAALIQYVIQSRI